MTKMLVAVSMVMAACADGEPDPHEIVDCEGQSVNGTPITECEAACSPFPGIPAPIPCVLEDGTSAGHTFGWAPARVRGVCVVELPYTRWVSCVD